MEKKSMLFYSKKDRLKNILAKPPLERGDMDLQEIMDLVSDVKFLKQFKESEQLKELCRYMYMQSYGVRKTVFEQGDEGDAFYIIHSGRVSVYVKIVSEISGNIHLVERYTKHVAELNKGDSFGELALIYGATRAASIVTSEPTDLIVLNKNTYDKVVKGIQVDQIDMVIEFFKHFPVFQDLPKDVLVNLATRSIFKKFPSNTVVIRQDDLSRCIYFIKAGRFKAIRKIDFQKPDLTSSQSIDFLIEEPSPESITKKRIETKLLEIDELGNGDCFGEHSIFRKCPMHHSVVSIIPSEVFMLDEHDFLALDEKILEEFKGFSKPYPSDKDLRKAYIEMNRWTRFKKDIVKNVRADKNNKKWNFDQQLRKPVFIPKKIPNLIKGDLFKKPTLNKPLDSMPKIHTNYLASIEKFLSDSEEIKKK